MSRLDSIIALEARMSSRSPIARVSLRGRVMRWAMRGLGLGMLMGLCIGGYFWFSTDLPTPEQDRKSVV